MPIKGVTDVPRLPRVGKIHLGIKATNSQGREYPQAVDYFVLPPEVEAAFDIPEGGLKELPIVFPHDDLNLIAPAYYMAYSARGLTCKGDGELARQLALGGAVRNALADEAEDPELRELLAERATLQTSLDELRARKDSLAEDEYLAQLEELLVRIAETDEAIRARGDSR